LQQLDKKAAVLEGAPRGGNRGAAMVAGAQLKTFSQLQGDYAALFTILEEADLAPTTQAVSALQATEQAARQTTAVWTGLQKELPILNTQLKTAGLEPLKIH
jgi:hypothetical protein